MPSFVSFRPENTIMKTQCENIVLIGPLIELENERDVIQVQAISIRYSIELEFLLYKLNFISHGCTVG